MLKINEIFYSIQGESSYSGLPTVFVRTTGCPLRCTYCDTKYSYFEGAFLSIDQIIKKILSYNTKYVCLTGGEPLAQKEVHLLMTELCQLGYLVSLETSGAKSIENVPEKVKIILDVKTPDSGEGQSFLFDNLKWAKPSTEFKFVLCSETDFDWSELFCRQYELFGKYSVLYSPSFGQLSPRRLAEKILEKNSLARLQLQLQKYIWTPETRGV
ncbi:MAG: radical SAM protein [Bdellovibrionaceae bacterium]|nr:radical SAM protein [Pseudobdellovibrionaceae bacterium]